MMGWHTTELGSNYPNNNSNVNNNNNNNNNKLLIFYVDELVIGINSSYII